MKPTVVYYYHIQEAKTQEGASAIIDNLRAQGVDHIRATWNREKQAWIIEYKIPREDP